MHGKLVNLFGAFYRKTYFNIITMGPFIVSIIRWSINNFLTTHDFLKSFRSNNFLSCNYPNTF